MHVAGICRPDFEARVMPRHVSVEKRFPGIDVGNTGQPHLLHETVLERAWIDTVREPAVLGAVDPDQLTATLAPKPGLVKAVVVPAARPRRRHRPGSAPPHAADRALIVTHPMSRSAAAHRGPGR